MRHASRTACRTAARRATPQKTGPCPCNSILPGLPADVFAATRTKAQEAIRSVRGSIKYWCTKIERPKALASKQLIVQEEFEEETDWSMGLPSKATRIDFRKAQEFGLPPQLISDQLYYGLHGGFTDEFCWLPNIRQGTPLVRYEPAQRRDNETDLNQASLVNAQGATVPLKSFANATDRAASTVVVHDGMRRVITVLGYYRPDGPPSLDLSMELIRKAGAGISWPLGYGLEMRGDMTQMMDSFRRLFWGLGLSVFFIYMMLSPSSAAGCNPCR